MNRINLETTPIKVATHTAFYRWAAQWVDGRKVLDAGCGEGFGTVYLADPAKLTVGIDKDPRWIERAFNLYSADDVNFFCMDCQNASFASDSFDIVISNALLEYLDDVQVFLTEAFRILRPNGMFICGTKNRELSLKTSDNQPLYRNHLQEYTPFELRSLLAEYFAEVDLYGQRMNPRSEAYINSGKALQIEGALVKSGMKHNIPRNLRSRIRKLITGVNVADIGVHDFEIVRQGLDDSFYIIGCGYKP